MSYYPSSSGSVVEHAGRPAADDGRGSFGPVLLVLAVVSFLSVAACVAGRVCDRGSPSASLTATDDQREGTEKQGATQMPVIMRPVASSRAAVHDLEDDVSFEVKLLPPHRPAARDAATAMQGATLPRRQFMTASGAAPGLRGPPGAAGLAAFVPAQRGR